MTPALTIPQLLAYRPCARYSPERIAELYAGREALSLPEVLALDIPPRDRLWVTFTGHWFERNDYIELTCRFADQAVASGRAALVHVPDGEDRPRLALEAAEHAIQITRGVIAGTETPDAARAARAAADAARAADAAAYAADAARAARAADAAHIPIVLGLVAEIEAREVAV